MKDQDITEMFTAILFEKFPGKVLNIDNKKINNYRHRGLPSLGTMIELLYQAGKITITANEPKE